MSSTPGLARGSRPTRQVFYFYKGDIVRFLEDKYNLTLNRKVLARRLRREMVKRHPAERDCQQLISNLFSLTETYPGMFCRAMVVDDNAFHSVYWSFPKWREEYNRFDVVPVVSIDAKAIANDDDAPLAIICGRTNNRAVSIYFLGFLASQRQEEFLWFLRQFREYIQVPPRLFACDQDAAIINSIERIFPISLVILDDWHFNNNQLKNCQAAASKLDINGEGYVRCPLSNPGESDGN